MFGLRLALVAATIVLAAASEQQFSSELFGLIAKDHVADNVILSPLSIESCLSLLYLGAEGSTATELADGLRLESSDKAKLTSKFAKLFENSTDDDDGTAILRIANRIYLDKKYEIAPQFNQLAEKHFGASVEKVDFAQSQPAADKINAWVEEKTEHKIQNLVASDSLDKSTASVLVNAIYFKAKWENIFSVYDSQVDNFRLSPEQTIQVDTMYQTDYFWYGDLKELKAKAIELKYQHSKIAMLIILPKKIDGLPALEEKLKTVDLKTLSEQLRPKKVRVSLPKFKVELDLSLKPTLEKLGIKEIFTNAADFSSLLATKQSLHVDEVKHKAFLEVNEMGTEAAAATYVKISPWSFSHEKVYDFIANHPFVFALVDKEHEYFVGHIVKP